MEDKSTTGLCQLLWELEAPNGPSPGAGAGPEPGCSLDGGRGRPRTSLALTTSLR